jgi:chromosome segregation ATPase
MTSNISTQDINQGNEDFEEELNQLNNQIKTMKDTATNNLKNSDELQSKMDYVSNQLTNLYEQLSGVETNIDSCTDTVKQADDINEENQDSVDVIRNQLVQAGSKLNQAQDALFQAKAIADNYQVKEENMTKLAQKAQAIADGHEEDAKEITATAQQALDNSRAAETAIQEAIDLLENLLSTLDDLKESENKLQEEQALRDNLLSKSTEVKANAESAKNEATDLFTEAGKLALPDVDTEDMETRALNAQNEAEGLMPKVEGLNKEFDDNWTALESDRQVAQSLLDNADATQDTIDMLLAQAHNALKVAEDAVAEGNATYESLKATRASLQSFDEEISSNRQQAEAALNKSDSIQQNIDEANSKTDAAKASLGQATTIATSASEKAHQAQVTAENVQAEAGAILGEAAASQTKAEDISDKVDQLNNKLDGTDTLLQEVEGKAAADQKAVEDATNAASTARGNAVKSKNRVDNAIQQLNQLLADLENAPDVSDDEIAAAEVRFAELQKEIEDANVEALLASLEQQNTVFENTLRQYDLELAEVEADVQNLSDINDALPVTCANDTPVEQP